MLKPHPTPSEGADRVKALARDLGFDLCGVAPAAPDTEDRRRYDDWIARGRHGAMDYLARNGPARANPDAVLPGARSVVCCALLYHTDHPLSVDVAAEAGRGWVSRYGWGDDYHDVMRPLLKRLAAAIVAEAPGARVRACVDTAPLPERSLAWRAGLGWIGRNGALINERLGSFLVLGEVVTDLDLAPDAPAQNRCGDCDRCLRACPGGALVAPAVVDARRCASYLTIEHRGAFGPETPRAALGRNVFGCDICQDVCPWNAKAPHTDRPAFQPRPGLYHPHLGDWRALDEAQFAERFAERFAGSPIRRCGPEGWRRNVDAALSHQGAAAAPPAGRNRNTP